MRYYAVFQGSMNGFFSYMKIYDVFAIYTLNIDLRYSLELPHLGGI